MADMRLGIVVDTDTRATKQEFAALRRDVKREAEALGNDWEAAGEKVEQALRDAGARDDLIDAARRIGTEGPNEIEKMRTALKDTGDDARNLSDDIDDAAKGIKDSFEENALTPQDIFKESLRAELVSNMSETGAEVVRGFKDGFDSEDLSTVVDGVTDTMVSIGALGGPAGTAAGIAGGALVQAFAGPFIADAEAKAAEFESIYADAFDNIVEHGAEMGRELTINSAATAISKDTERLAEAQEVAATTGADLAVVIRAMAGDSEALALVQDVVADKEERLAQVRETSRESTDKNSDSIVGWTEESRKAVQESSALSTSLDTLTEDYDNAARAADAAAEGARAKADVDNYATRKALDNAAAMAKQTGEAQELTAEIDGVSQAIKVMPNGKVVRVTDKGTAKEVQGKISNIEGASVTVGVYADTGPAERTLDSLRYRGGTIYMDVRTRRVGGFYK